MIMEIIKEILNIFAPYVPLLQTLVWIAIIIFCSIIFRRQILSLLDALKDRVSSGSPVKAGFFELGAPLEQPETIAALEGVVSTNKARTEKEGEELENEEVLAQLGHIDHETLRKRLTELSPILARIRGAKLLWIDDRPESVLAERRLIRALGGVIVPADSSEAALDILKADTDFDLIVTDVQRKGEFHKYNEGVEIHDGVNFIVYLRSKHKDPFVRIIPVLFYAAYNWERLRKFTKPCFDYSPNPQISNSAADLIPKVIKILSEARRLAIPGMKGVTVAR